MIEELGKDIKGIFTIRVDRRVIGVEELKSGVSFLKFFSGQFFYTKDHLFYKNFFLIRVDRRVIGVGELESDVRFLKFLRIIFFRNRYHTWK